MTHVDSPTEPRTLADPLARNLRRSLLNLPHIAPLTKYAQTLRDEDRGNVAEFDPLDGGINAQALFLFEKPGPMTAGGEAGRRVGSGFISRDNDDPTADATFRFMGQAGIPRELTVTWNAIPWWNGTRKITSEELHAGLAALERLIGLLPQLKVVVFVGRKAARSKPYLASTGLALFESAHPSPLVRASQPQNWYTIPNEWAKIKPFLI